MSGSLSDYAQLRRAHDDMAHAIKVGVNRIAGEAARTCLLVAADRCGYDGKSPLLIWSQKRLETFDTFMSGSFRELDEKLSALPKGELEALFPVVAVRA